VERKNVTFGIIEAKKASIPYKEHCLITLQYFEKINGKVN
jgi:hypothetical protein